MAINPITGSQQRKFTLGYNDPALGFQSYIDSKGFGGGDPLSAYYQNQYANANNRWQVANAGGEGGSFLDYLSKDPNLSDRGKGYRNTDPQSGFYAYLGNKGLDGAPQGAAGYAQSQFGRVSNQYQAWLGNTGQTMGFYDWLRQHGPNLNSEYNAQSQQERGIYSNISMPRVRWNL